MGVAGDFMALFLGGKADRIFAGQNYAVTIRLNGSETRGERAKDLISNLVLRLLPMCRRFVLFKVQILPYIDPLRTDRRQVVHDK